MITTKRENKRTIWNRKASQRNPREALREYLAKNDDLPPNTAMALAPFALAPRLGVELTGLLFKGVDPRTPVRHRAWFWWSCLRLSGLEDYWFADEYNRGDINFREWMRRIKETPKADRTLLLNRLNIKDLWVKDRAGPPSMLWTKGGGWPRGQGMARVLVLGENIDRPITKYDKRIDWRRMEALEGEIHRTGLADRMIYPDAYDTLCHYTIGRFRNVTASKVYGWPMLTWFYQQPIYQTEIDKWYLTTGKRSRAGGSDRGMPVRW